MMRSVLKMGILPAVACFVAACGDAGLPEPPTGLNGHTLNRSSTAKPSLTEGPQGESEVFALAADDIEGTENPETTRYFTLVHLIDEEKPGVKTARKAVTKLLNALSWEGTVKAPTPVVESRTVLRVNLNDYGWSADQWETLVAEHPLPDDPPEGLPALQKATGTDKPVIRGDWFIANASVAPLYYHLLNMPEKLPDLESRLGVTLSSDVEAGNVIRSGFDDSIVSTNHRVIERHESDTGFFWRSYEFGSKEGNQNIFENPLGPGGAADSGGPGFLGGLFSGGNRGNRKFKADGGEFLFSLPNGMMGFYIATADGKRLDEVPVDQGQQRILAGADCMGCHTRGPINHEDMVRQKVASASNFPAEAAAKVKELYVDPDSFKKAIEGDRALHQQALETLGITLDDGGPVKRIREAY